MNARQKAKKYKKKIKNLEADNDLMRRIIADSPAMQELYDAYNKPTFIKNTTMYFQEYRAVRRIPNHITDATGLVIKDIEGMIEYTKQALERDVFEGIKESITYEVDNMNPIITASVFVGRK